MITIRPGVSPTSLLEQINRVSSDLVTVQGAQGSKDALERYLFWAYDSIRVLGPHIRNSDIDRLITTKPFWALQSVIDPSDHSMIRHFINLEVSERIRDFELEILDLKREISKWNSFGLPSFVAVVLDTNVLLDHHEELASIEWNVKLNLLSNIAIDLSIPLAVIDELDRLKRDGSKNVGKEPGFRAKARQALRTLENLTKGEPGNRTRLRMHDFGSLSQSSDIYLSIILDEQGHVPLEHVDSEIVDRAITLLPYAHDVRIATYDTGMEFRARHAGLKVCKFTYSATNEN